MGSVFDGLMASKEEKKIGRIPLANLLASLLLLASSALEFYGFYLTDFKLFTLPALGVLGLLTASGLVRVKSWGPWLFYALYLPQVVQGGVLLWSLVLLEGFHLSTLVGLLEVGLVAYLVLLTLSLLFLLKGRGAPR